MGVLALTLALASAMSVSACYTQQQQTGTLAGGAIVAGTGAPTARRFPAAAPAGPSPAHHRRRDRRAGRQRRNRAAGWALHDGADDPNGNRVCTAWN